MSNEHLLDYQDILSEADDAFDEAIDKLDTIAMALEDIEMSDVSYEIERARDMIAQIQSQMPVYTMSVDDVMRDFNENVRPEIIRQYSEDDIPALREGFHNYVDGLQKADMIPEYLNNWIEGED